MWTRENMHHVGWERSGEPCEIFQFLFALPVSSLPVSLKLLVKLNTGEGSELYESDLI